MMPFINDRLAHNAELLDEQKTRQQLDQTVPNRTGSQAPERLSRFKFEPAAVMALLEQRIVGQPQILSVMCDLLHVVKADVGADDRPRGVLLFLGPTGVGKTETVRVLAEAIYGSPDKFCRIDMNTLAQEHYAAAFTGAPPGYVGSKEGQTLFDIETIQGSYSKPGIVLFDELEKASTEVVRSLLNVLDSGKLVLTSGAKTIDFRNSLIFMTSNIGAAEVRSYRDKFQRGWRRWLHLSPRYEQKVQEQALHQRFDPEFLNRIDHILAFNRLGGEWLDALLEIELNKLQRRLQKQQASLRLTPDLRIYLCQQHDSRFGARHLARRLLAELQPPLSYALLSEPDACEFEACLFAGQVRVRAMPIKTQ